MLRVLFLTAAFSACAQALTSEAASQRLRLAMQLAREHNNPELVLEVEQAGRQIRSELNAGSEALLQSVEARVGLDPGGRSMAGQPIFHPTPGMEAALKELDADLAAAMHSEDVAKVRSAISKITETLGSQAGVPDARRPGRRVQGLLLQESEATELFVEALRSEGSSLRQLMAGKPLPNQMLRIHGDILRAVADIFPLAEKHVHQALPDLTRLAEGTAKVLLNLQQPDGHFPFPDLRGKNLRFGAMIERAVAAGRAEVREGWLISPDPDGGSQFDTGVCGAALLRAGKVFHQESWLAAGLRAADWAAGQKCCANFNYNAFSISLLAEAWRVTSLEPYRAAALKKFRLGLAPGQAANGRWLDPHNARTVYHVIILRALGDLASIVGDERDEVDRITQPAVRALLDEFDAMGITVEALPELLRLSQLHASDLRLKAAVQSMASTLVEKCRIEGRRPRMGAQPNQLAVLPQVR